MGVMKNMKLKLLILFFVLFGLSLNAQVRPDQFTPQPTITDSLATYGQEAASPEKYYFIDQNRYFQTNSRAELADSTAVLRTAITNATPDSALFQTISAVLDTLQVFRDTLTGTGLVVPTNLSEGLSVTKDTVKSNTGSAAILDRDIKFATPSYTTDREKSTIYVDPLDTLPKIYDFENATSYIIRDAFNKSGTAYKSNTWELQSTDQVWNTTGRSGTFAIDGGSGFVGIGDATPDHVLKIQADGNSSLGIKLNNTTTGTAARSHFEMGNDVGTQLYTYVHGSAYTPSGLFQPNTVVVRSSASAGYFLGTDLNAPLSLYSGGLSGSNVNITMSGSGKIGFGQVYEIYGGATQSYLHSYFSDAVTATTFELERTTGSSTGTATNGFGFYNTRQLKTSTGFVRDAQRESIYWTDATEGSQDSEYQLWLSNNAVIDTALIIRNDGFIKPISGIIDSDGDTGTEGQILTAKADGKSDWVNTLELVSLTGDAEQLPTFNNITAGTASLANGGCPFTAADVGKTIIIYGAGTGTDGNLGDELITTILTYNNACSVTLADNATVSVTNAIAWMGTDNTAIIEAAFTNNSALFFPKNTTPQNYLFAGTVDIDTINNSSLTGNGDTLLFISANPNSYISGSEPNKNLFELVGCDNISFKNFVAKNIGQTTARPTTAQEGGYYTTLNGSSITYNRHYNKQANHGMVVDFQNSKNIELNKITSINTGGLARATSGGTPYENQLLLVTNCAVYGWGGSAVYPCDFSTITNCYFDNSASPVLNSTDISSDYGTSHVTYSAAGYKNIIIHENEIRYCRGTAIQWNTSTGRNCENNIVSNNNFYECSRAGSLIGNQELLQVNLTGNTYYKCGRWLLQSLEGNFNFIGENWDSTYSGNNDFEGAFNIGAAGTINISDCKFSRVTTAGNVAPIQASGHSLASDYNLTIDNCFFDSTNNRSFLFLTNDDSLSGQIVLKNNEFLAPVYIVGTAGAPTHVDGNGINKFFIKNNNFHVRGDNHLNVRLGATVSGNNFYQTDTNYGINVDLIEGSGYIDLHNNNFYNRGGQNVLLLSSSTSNQDSVSFADNSIFGDYTITKNGNDFRSGGVNYYNGIVNSSINSTTLAAAATTLAITSNVLTLTGDGGGNTLATITGGVSGQTLTIIFVDANVTITDTGATTANTVNLSAAFTSTADDVLTLVYDGNKWFETSRSTN